MGDDRIGRRSDEPFVAGWVREPSGDERGAFRQVVSAVASHFPAAVGVFLLVVAIAVVGWSRLPPTYDAEALLAVSPVPAGSGISELASISDVGGLTRDVETLSRIVRTSEVAEAARQTLRTPEPADKLLGKIVATPIGTSYLVSVAASGGTAAEAAKTANAFAHATVTISQEHFQVALAAAIQRAGDQKAALPAGSDVEQRALEDRLAELLAYRDAPDPSVQLRAEATVPSAPSSPGIARVLLAALVIGAIAAVGIALLLETLRTRIRSEGDFTGEFRIPVLARVPIVDRMSGRPATGPSRSMPPAVAEAFRTLRQSIGILRRASGEPRSVLFTSTSVAEGKTTCAIRAAIAFAEAGEHVLLVDADFRNPSIGREFSAASKAGVIAVTRGVVELRQAAVRAATETDMGALDLLLYNAADDAGTASGFDSASVRLLLAQAGEIGVDIVIFDTAPLGLIADSLPILTAVDDVLVVVYRERTRRSRLLALMSTCARYGVTPRGFVYVGASRKQVAEIEGAARSAAQPVRPASS